MECECEELKERWKARKLSWIDIQRIRKIFTEVNRYWDEDRTKIISELECNKCGTIVYSTPAG